MLYPNIRAEMGRSGCTVEKLAEILGLSPGSVSMKLNGKREFTLSEIERIADFFDCSLDYLVGHRVRTRTPSNRSGNGEKTA
ncbi:MAG TPA: helix-turn-helix transcriptional regulator [Candidatus Onthovicinus excrementipullorum]|nr:helix-turn-helix transcriptional regulator [Candidatus Onthovicinus excrementipullorum]